MRAITTIEYGSAEYWRRLLAVDVHEYVDSCGVGWYVADDFSFRAKMPD